MDNRGPSHSSTKDVAVRVSATNAGAGGVPTLSKKKKRIIYLCHIRQELFYFTDSKFIRNLKLCNVFFLIFFFIIIILICKHSEIFLFLLNYSHQLHGSFINFRNISYKDFILFVDFKPHWDYTILQIATNWRRDGPWNFTRKFYFNYEERHMF